MRNYLLNMSLLALALTSISAQAEVISKEAIPAPIMEQFYKKHPNAVEISAAKKMHFKQTVFEIMFKEEKDKEKLIELYRPNGRFFVNANNVQGANMMPAIALDNLKTIFDTYTVLIVNPNGVGEEYDLVVNAGGIDWNVVVDRSGAISQKERN
jgi:hypothetical protein